MAMKPLLFGLLWAVSLSPYTAPAQPAEPLTLEAAERLALARHPMIESGNWQMKAAEQETEETRADYLPQIEGNAVRAFAEEETSIAAGSGLNDSSIDDRGSLGLQLRQLLTDFGRTHDRMEASRLRLTARMRRSELNQAEILRDVRQAYYQALSADTQRRAMKQILRVEEMRLQRKAAAKQTSKADAMPQGIDQTKILLLKAETAYREAMATLAEALGGDTNVSFSLAAVAPPPPPPADREALIRAALAQHPELAALEAESEAAKREAEAAEKAHYPTVSALAVTGASPIRDESQLDAHYNAAGIHISIPFYTGGRLTAQEKGSDYRARAAYYDAQTRKNRLVRDLRIAFDRTQAAYENIHLTRRFARHAAAGLASARKRQAGKSSDMELYQAWLSSMQASSAYLQSVYDYLIQRAELRYLSGEAAPAG